jgi:long-chain acyl-CoA synthetase
MTSEQLTPVVPATVQELLEKSVSNCPDAIALIGDDWSLTFAELDRQINKACHALSEEGVRRGSTVAVSAGNCADIVVAFLAVMRLGGRWVGLNKALSDFQRRNLIAHSRARVILTDTHFEMPNSARTAASSSHLSVIHMGTKAGENEWESRLMAASTAERKRVTIDPFAPAAILYTSGTSGSPKGVVHSQHNISLPGRYLATTRDFDSTAVAGVCLPLSILNVMAISVLPAIFAQRPCVVLPRPDAVLIAEWVERHGISTMSIPPPTLFDLANRPEVPSAALRTLQGPRTGGAELPDEVRHSFFERFGHEIVATYGLTEVPTLVSAEPRGASHIPGSSGEVVPYLRVRILDDRGEEVPAGETGEICVGANESGPWAHTYRPMLGYWRRPALTRRALRNELLHTGDLGTLKDGRVYTKDRKNNLILRGGANIYPAQVERIIRSVAGVADCVVIGLPDPRLGQRVVVAIEPDGRSVVEAEQVLDYCRNHLSQYEIPEFVVFVDTLPRNSMNKVVRQSVLDEIEPIVRAARQESGKVRADIRLKAGEQ